MLGLERGFVRVIPGARTVAYVEIEAFIIENLVQQMEQGVLAPAPVHSDVKTFPFEIFRDKIHWIIGGYPCQPFSYAGLRGGSDDPRHIWPFIARGIKKSRPMGIFFENVEGHISLGLRDVLTNLRKLGYQVEVGMFSAAEVGAPHRRNRVFILGMENTYIHRNGRSAIEAFITARALSIQAERSSALAHTGSGGSKPQSNGGDPFKQKKGPEEFLPSNDVANSDSKSGTIPNKGWRKDTEISGPSESIPNTFRQGLAEREIQSTREEQPSIERSDNQDRWPASPGEPQHSWEEPRLESSMGYATNGYNFREDLLRMAGNAVVEQQAELAFRTLLMKFLKNQNG